MQVRVLPGVLASRPGGVTDARESPKLEVQVRVLAGIPPLPVVQLEKTPGYEPGNWRFESSRGDFLSFEGLRSDPRYDDLQEERIPWIRHAYSTAPPWS